MPSFPFPLFSPLGIPGLSTIDYTTTALLAAVRRSGKVPNSSDSEDDTALLSYMTEELHLTLTALLLGSNGERLIHTSDSTIVSGQEAYDIPYRAVGDKLRNLQVGDGSSYATLDELPPERQYDGYTGYIFQDTSVILVPVPSSGGTLRFSYYRRPNELVAPTAVAQINAINTGTKTVTVSNVPSSFLTSLGYDIIRGAPGFKSLGDDLTISGISGSDITFTAALPTSLALGDWVCLAGQSPVPQIPVELHPYLVARTRYRALLAGGFEKEAVIEEAEAEKAKVRALQFLAPRGEGRGPVIINRNGPGFGRRLARFRR